MIKIRKSIKLAPYTTFKIGGPAKYFVNVKNLRELKRIISFAKKCKQKVLFLGGGSNMLVSDKGFSGVVIKLEFKKVKIVKQSGKKVLLEIGNGENWDRVVQFAVKKNFWGIENLSHIPGNAGALAVQNVGAYGQEASKIIKELLVFDTKINKVRILKNKDCKFGYRKSIFNTTAKGRYVILYLNLELFKSKKPNLSYRDLKQKFESKKGINIVDIRNTVIKIRNKKFPFPTKSEKGNCGSFFKNLVISAEQFKNLQKKISKNYLSELLQKSWKEKGKVKVPAAFLLEISGVKNLQSGGAAINYNQPLIIINKNGKAQAKDVLNLAKKVLRTVNEKTGAELKVEPELVGFSKRELNGIIN